MDLVRLTPVLICAALLSASPEAAACGGLFCDGATMEPVEQGGERILFKVNDDGTICTYVEIQYVGETDRFAWLLPIPESIPAESVEVFEANLFNELEPATAPTFAFPPPQTACSRRSRVNWRGDVLMAEGADGGGVGTVPAEPDVEVVDEANVGPFAIEVIEARDSGALLDWLNDNGYFMPDSALPALEHYVDMEVSYLGVQLLPEETVGTIETMKITYPGSVPMIPLILTGIASVPDMPILTYVVADEAHVPGNFTDLDFDHDTVEQVDGGGTTYRDQIKELIDDDGGHAWMTEYRDHVSNVTWQLSPDVAAALGESGWITRFRTYMSPEDMTVDPEFAADPDAGPVSNLHVVPPAERSGCGPGGGARASWILWAPLLLPLARRFRRAR